MTVDDAIACVAAVLGRAGFVWVQPHETALLIESACVLAAEVERLRLAVAELEDGYRNSAELALTYHGQLERANHTLALLRGEPEGPADDYPGKDDGA